MTREEKERQACIEIVMSFKRYVGDVQLEDIAEKIQKRSRKVDTDRNDEYSKFSTSPKKTRKK